MAALARASDGVYVAHGFVPAFVGKTLPQIIAGVPSLAGVVDGTQLYQSFVAAGNAGGGLVRCRGRRGLVD